MGHTLCFVPQDDQESDDDEAAVAECVISTAEEVDAPVDEQVDAAMTHAAELGDAQAAFEYF